MRRAFAVLALVVTSWPHAVVLECALGSAAVPAGVEAAHESTRRAGHHHEQHGAHHASGGDSRDRSDVGSPAIGDDAAPHGGTSCAMVMACGLVMIGAVGAETPADALSTAHAVPSRRLESPSAADPASETPPPRRYA